MFNVQGVSWTYLQLTRTLISAVGGKLTEAYFTLLDMEISDCLYHLYNYIQYMKDQQPSKLDQWGCSDLEFE